MGQGCRFLRPTLEQNSGFAVVDFDFSALFLGVTRRQRRSRVGEWLGVANAPNDTGGREAGKQNHQACNIEDPPRSSGRKLIFHDSCFEESRCLVQPPQAPVSLPLSDRTAVTIRL